MRFVPIVVFCGLTVPAAAGSIYKCEDKGAVTYTDQPCHSGAVASELPGVVIVASPTQSERELARQYDARLQREKSGRDASDAKWLKTQRDRKARAEAVRKAIIEHRVIRGMSMDEVRSSLGDPQRVDRSESYGSNKETWTYSGDGHTRTVNFKDGEVSTSTRRERGHG